MNDTLEHYLNLPYEIKVNKISDEDGGGYMAYLIDFPNYIIGDGNTEEEAIEDLKNFQKVAFKRWMVEDLDIPLPSSVKD